MKYTWLMTFEEFNQKFITQNFKQYADDYFSLSKKHCVGCHYYLTISADLEIINPYTKKDKQKKVLKTIVSTSSIKDVKQQAFEFIIAKALEFGLYDESICPKEIKIRQLSFYNSSHPTSTLTPDCAKSPSE